MDTILIIDDRKGMLDMLSKTFQPEGFRVLTAANVADARGLIDQGEMDIIVTDLKLPDGDGLDVLRAAKERFPLLPVVLMTAHGSIEIAVRAVKAGAYDFVTKPFDPEHLVIIVRRALAERSSRRENIILKREFSRFLSMPEIIGSSRPWLDVM
jgi:DNA-binding NtrC family response regulator